MDLCSDFHPNSATSTTKFPVRGNLFSNNLASNAVAVKLLIFDSETKHGKELIFDKVLQFKRSRTLRIETQQR
jgi:hypothetical protein